MWVNEMVPIQHVVRYAQQFKTASCWTVGKNLARYKVTIFGSSCWDLSRQNMMTAVVDTSLILRTVAKQ